MKVIFSTNLPSPYRVDFFNELGKYCNLTVLYERCSSAERNAAWKGTGAEHFEEVYLNLSIVGIDRSRGAALRKYITTHKCDFLIFSNYVSPATMEAIIYCRLNGKPYYIEYDGGFNKRDSFLNRIIKKVLLCGAKGHLTTCEEHIKYLKSIGIKTERIHKYPFSSVRKQDIIGQNVISDDMCSELREKLGMKEKHIILSVGRFSYEAGYGKGYDLLLDIAEQMGTDIGFYIVGDEPTEEFIKFRKERNLSNIHYVGFKNKKELTEYYMAADLFMLLSRGDVWGLVVNEAMAMGLPVISSDRCIAGTELVKNGKNGFVVSLNNVTNIISKINYVFSDNSKRRQMGFNSIEIIKNYTIEKMAESHSLVFNVRP